MKYLIQQGTVFDPRAGTQGVQDVLIADATIAKIAPQISAPDARVFDARGRWVVPGLVDAHVHFRQPGEEHKEDIASGSRAAAAGGFTAVVAEPNTRPPLDSSAGLGHLLHNAARQSVVRFFSKACITRGQQGLELTDAAALRRAGAVALSDDGNPVPDPALMEAALRQAAQCGIVVSPHCEESSFYRDRFLAGRPVPSSVPPYAAEAAFVERDVALAERTGARIHISHVSLARSVEIIARARQRGVRVTAEATPHHCVLTEDRARKIGPNAKANPPLRSQADVEAVCRGLADGTIDIIASDHAPHAVAEKSVPWDHAPFGVIGLETTLGVILTHLVPRFLSPLEAIRKMSDLPARIFGLPDGVGSLSPGCPADITVIDPDLSWRVDTARFQSKARNCPFQGCELRGKAVTTFVNGRPVMVDGEILSGSA